MAKNWLAYEACEVLLAGTDKEAVSEIGSRFPLFTVAVMRDGTKTLLDILKAIPKVTARVVETGLKDTDVVEAETETEEVEEEVTPKKETKTSKKVTKKVEEAEEDGEDESENDYESMTGAELYKLCCARGISSLCKSRSKTALIEILEKFDAGEIEATKKDAKKEVKETKETKPAKANNKKVTKKVEVEEEDEDWEDEEDEDEVDPYKGKTAKELYKMCVDRDIKTKPKQSADVYAKLLKKADAEAEVEEDEEDEDDDWEI